MARTGSLFLLLISNILIQGTLIDPLASDAGTKAHYHCLYSNQPIQIKDPFSPDEIENPGFISMDWYKSRVIDEEITLVVVGKTNKRVIDPAVSIFEFWGLQINTISLDTDGNYTAKLVRLSTHKTIKLNITIVVPPVLKSSQLTLKRSTHEDNSATLLCGPIVSLGDPQVSILFKDDSGSVLHTVTELTNGYAEITESGGPAAKICEVDSSLGATCINNRAKWRATLNGNTGAQPMPCLWTGQLVLMAAVVQVYS